LHALVLHVALRPARNDDASLASIADGVISRWLSCNCCCSRVPRHQQRIAAIRIVLSAQAHIHETMLPIESDGPAVVGFDFKYNLHTVCITPAGHQASSSAKVCRLKAK
jgi:hypothetical protein